MTERNAVYINLPNAFIRGPYKNSKGIEFYKCIIPEGVIVEGKNVGGYSFTSRFASAPPDWKQRDEDGKLLRDSNGGVVRNHNAKYKQLPVISDSIRLEKIVKDQDGNYNTEDEFKVGPEVLKEALIKHQKEYRSKEKENINE